ncbi:hypothetical protein CQW23_32454 [Capsicum baccatum]|uniref:Uncharacterized protein n=1 Tax=Capsicum baccatum TaxID=33114 RepID=A0A2G2V4N1_CAPBA|nr:hypothetical protein CQW23_32454 [Capsicum baccatum]
MDENKKKLQDRLKKEKLKDRANQFYLEIRKYYPGLKDGSLDPGYAGIRPKLFGPEEGSTDFVVQVTHRTYSKFHPEWSLKF